MTGRQCAYLAELETETRTGKALLYLLAGFLLNGQIAKPRQTWMAKRLGCHRRTIIRAVQELERLGYVQKIRRGWGRSNVYKLAKRIWVRLCKGNTLKDLREKARKLSQRSDTSRTYRGMESVRTVLERAGLGGSGPP